MVVGLALLISLFFLSPHALASLPFYGEAESNFDFSQRFNQYKQQNERYFNFTAQSSCILEALHHSALLCCNTQVAYYATLPDLISTQTETGISLLGISNYTCDTLHQDGLDIYAIRRDKLLHILIISSTGVVSDTTG